MRDDKQQQQQQTMRPGKSVSLRKGARGEGHLGAGQERVDVVGEEGRGCGR